MIASISPFSIAATAPAEVPTPMIETSFDVSPPLLSRWLTTMCVLEPGALTPIFMPLRSFGDL